MEMSCPLWIPVAAGLGVLLFILIPLAANRSKWKKKSLQSEEETKSLRNKAEKEVTTAKENARKEMEKLQKETDQKLAEASRTAQAEADGRIEELMRAAEMDLVAVKERTERILHEEREVIQSNEDEWKQMDEKELLLNVMKALGGYGTRLDRMEKDISEVGKKIKYQGGSVTSREHAAAVSRGATPLLDYLRDELNSAAGKES